MPIVDKHFRVLYATLFVIFALFGTSMTVIGATLPNILADFGWSYATAGAVLAAGSIGYFVSIYVAGQLINIAGPKATIALGLALEIGGLALFGIVPSPLINFVLYLGVGFGQGFIELVVNWATLRMDKSGSGRAMNLMHGAFAIGALAGPFINGVLMGFDLSWTLVYRGISVLFIGVLAVAATLPFTALSGEEKAEDRVSNSVLFRKPAYWLGFAALFVYVGVELGVSNWVAEYFVSVFKSSVSVGSFMVAVFWAGLLAGRVGVPLLYKGKRQGRLLMLLSILTGATVMALSVLGALSSGAAGPVLLGSAVGLVFLAGLGCSCVYPIVITLQGASFPTAQSQAIAFASTGGGIGSFAFPFAMSGISTLMGIRAGFATYGVFAVLLIVASGALLRASAVEASRSKTGA